MRPTLRSARQHALTGLLAAIAAASAQAQNPPPSVELFLSYDSGLVANALPRPAVVISRTVRVEGAEWLRLSFREIQLAGDPDGENGSILRITSFLDGGVQEQSSVHVGQWQKTSAYFNGDTLQIDVVAHPRSGNNRIVLDRAWAGLADNQKSQCGPSDNRVLSSDPRAARALPIGCSAWIFDDCTHCMGTAGHCSGSSLSVIQFNVPLSSSNGSLNNPPPEDQYAVDAVSRQAVNGGVGNDWGYFGVFPNTNTGLTPFQKQGASYHLQPPPAFNPSQQIRITGYGTDSSPLTHNQVQQTHFGPWALFSGSQLSYQTDTEGGNSGSPVIHEPTGNVIGVHTHGGCSTGGSGANSGTGNNNGGWQAALASPKGVCIPVATTSFYCTAKVNSQGCLPTITSVGTPSATAGAGSFLINSGLQLNQLNGLLFYGTLPIGSPFQGGFLCVGGATLRTPGQFSGGSPSGVDCSGSFSIDMGAYIASGVDPKLSCGAIIYTQYWGRDPGFGPPNNISLTRGLKFQIGP